MNPYRSQYIDLLQGTGPPLSEEQMDEVFSRLMIEANKNPEAAKNLDVRVMNAAYENGIPPDIATRIIAQGPYVQSQLQQEAPIGALMANHLTPLSTAYVRREVSDAVSAIRNEQQKQRAAQQSQSPKVAQVLNAPKVAYKTTAVFLGAGYNVLRTAEQSLFAITPLPMQQLKNGIQQVGLPLGVSFVAAQVPGVSQLVNGAIHFGGDLFGSGAKAATSSSLLSIGQQIQAGLPTGMGIQSVAIAIGNAVNPVMANLAQGSGQFLGSTATAVGIGKFVINGAQAVFSQVREKGAMRTIEDAIQGAQGAIARTQSFLKITQNKIRSLSQGAIQTMQKIPENCGIPQAEGLEAEKVLQVHKPLGSVLSTMHGLRNELNDYYRRASEGLDYLLEEPRFKSAEQSFEQAKERFIEEYNGLSPETIAQLRSGNPTVQPSELENGNGFILDPPEATDELIYTPMEPGTHSEEYEIYSQELGENEIPVKPEPVPGDHSEEYEILNQELGENEPPAVAEPEVKPPIQKENEDYGLSIQNMLSQRGIETQRFQIDVDGERAFKMENSLVTENKLDSSAVEAIKTALNDPSNLQGEVRITQGSKVLLHVKDGQVINDPLGLTKPSAKVEVNSPSQSLYNEASKEVPGSGLQRTQAIAANAFQSGASQEQVMNMIKNHDPEFSNQVKECGSEKAAMVAIGAAVKAAETQMAIAEQGQEPAQTKEPAMQR